MMSPCEGTRRPKRVTKEKGTLPCRSVTGPIERQGVLHRPALIPLFEGPAAEGGLKQELPRMLVNSGIGCWVSQRQSGNRLAARLHVLVQSQHHQPLP